MQPKISLLGVIGAGAKFGKMANKEEKPTIKNGFICYKGERI